jgi:hypothetical protein
MSTFGKSMAGPPSKPISAFELEYVELLTLNNLLLSCLLGVNERKKKLMACSVGATGIAVGLAAKEVVSNFFGGAVLLVTRPFVIGDRIKASEMCIFP